MKIRHIAGTALALALSTTLAWSAIAEDTKPAAPAAAPSTPAPAPAPAPAKPAAKPAKPKTEVKADVSGKLTTKTFKNKKGQEMEGLVLTVSSATATDGKPLAALKGKTLRVAGKKELNLKSHVDKEVTISGTVVNDRRLNAASIK